MRVIFSGDMAVLSLPRTLDKRETCNELRRGGDFEENYGGNTFEVDKASASEVTRDRREIILLQRCWKASGHCPYNVVVCAKGLFLFMKSPPQAPQKSSIRIGKG